MSERDRDRDRDRDRPHDDIGQFTATVTDDDILTYFREGRPFHTAREVADRFGLDRSTAHRRLSTLHEADDLEKVTLGHRTVVWWCAGDGAAGDDAGGDAPENEDGGEGEDGDGDDPLFTGPALIGRGDPESGEQIDDVLYGATEK